MSTIERAEGKKWRMCEEGETPDRWLRFQWGTIFGDVWVPVLSPDATRPAELPPDKCSSEWYPAKEVR